MKPIYLFMLLATFSQCKQEAKIHEVKNDRGNIIERYTYSSGTPSDKQKGFLEKFDDQGNLSEKIFYENGKMNGERQIYEKGILYSTETRKDDLFHGPYVSYHPNGNKHIECNYDHDVLKGDLLAYYPSGKRKEMVRFEENVENGPFTEYYENGNLKAEGHYVYREGAVEDGLLLLYDSTGVLEKKMNCIEGKCTTIWQKENQ